MRRLHLLNPLPGDKNKAYQRLCQQHQRLLQANGGHDDIALKANLLKLEQGHIPTSGELKQLIHAFSSKTDTQKIKLLLAVERALRGVFGAYKEKMASLKHRPLEDKELYQLGLLIQAFAHLPSKHQHKKAVRCYYDLLYHYASQGEQQRVVTPKQTLWANAVENLLLVQSDHFKFDSNHEDVRHLKKTRTTNPVAYRQACTLLKTKLESFHLQRRARDTFLHLRKHIWSQVAQREQCHEASYLYLRRLYQKAQRAQVTLLEQLSLSVFDENLLGLKEPHQEPIRSLNILLVLEMDYQAVSQYSKGALKDFIKRCEHELRLRQVGSRTFALSVNDDAHLNPCVHDQEKASRDHQCEMLSTPTSSM